MTLGSSVEKHLTLFGHRDQSVRLPSCHSRFGGDFIRTAKEKASFLFNFQIFIKLFFLVRHAIGVDILVVIDTVSMCMDFYSRN